MIFLPPLCFHYFHFIEEMFVFYVCVYYIVCHIICLHIFARLLCMDMNYVMPIKANKTPIIDLLNRYQPRGDWILLTVNRGIWQRRVICETLFTLFYLPVSTQIKRICSVQHAEHDHIYTYNVPATWDVFTLTVNPGRCFSNSAVLSL